MTIFLLLKNRFRKNNYIELAPWFQYTYAFFKFRENMSASAADVV